jgi:hypothetical protein
MIPIASRNPVALFNSLHIFLQGLNKVLLGFGFLQLNRVKPFAAHQEVDVRVRESWEDELVLGVDYLRGGSLKRKDRRVRTHRRYGVVYN